jgi:hypothetical protein
LLGSADAFRLNATVPRGLGSRQQSSRAAWTLPEPDLPSDPRAAGNDEGLLRRMDLVGDRRGAAAQGGPSGPFRNYSDVVA